MWGRGTKVQRGQITCQRSHHTAAQVFLTVGSRLCYCCILLNFKNWQHLVIASHVSRLRKFPHAVLFLLFTNPHPTPNTDYWQWWQRKFGSNFLLFGSGTLGRTETFWGLVGLLYLAVSWLSQAVPWLQIHQWVSPVSPLISTLSSDLISAAGMTPLRSYRNVPTTSDSQRAARVTKVHTAEWGEGGGCGWADQKT